MRRALLAKSKKKRYNKISETKCSCVSKERLKRSAMFAVKDKVVYPGHGVAVVESIVERSISGQSVSFVKLSFLYKDMVVFVPLKSLEQSKIRDICSPKEIDEALKILEAEEERKFESTDFTPSGWNKRNQKYQTAILRGEIKDLIHIYKELMSISGYKELSFGEKSLLSQIESLVTQEMVTVLDITQEKAITLLRDSFRVVRLKKTDPSPLPSYKQRQSSSF